MITANEIYARLGKWLRTPDAPSFTKVLEILITPEESALVLELVEPGTPSATCEQLSGRLGINEEKLRPQLEELVRRGWLRSTKEGYVAPPANPRFMPKVLLPGVSEVRNKQVWKDFFYQDWSRILVEEKEQQLAIKGYNQWRIAPSGKALAASPGIRPEQIMHCEDVRDMARRASDITVHECGCREGHQKCDRPLLTCIRAVWTGKVDTSDEKTGGHENQIHISAEKAIAIMDEAEESGLVHTLLNATDLGRAITICSCCPCCCYLLNPVLECGKLHKLIEPSRFKAVVDIDKCEGCQSCVEQCHFNAIEMRKVPGSKKMKAFTIDENCLGCGVCTLKCPSHALSLEMARPPAHIPVRPMSEVFSIPVRQAEA